MFEERCVKSEKAQWGFIRSLSTLILFLKKSKKSKSGPLKAILGVWHCGSVPFLHSLRLPVNSSAVKWTCIFSYQLVAQKYFFIIILRNFFWFKLDHQIVERTFWVYLTINFSKKFTDLRYFPLLCLLIPWSNPLIKLSKSFNDECNNAFKFFQCLLDKEKSKDRKI